MSKGDADNDYRKTLILRCVDGVGSYTDIEIIVKVKVYLQNTIYIYIHC